MGRCNTEENIQERLGFGPLCLVLGFFAFAGGCCCWFKPCVASARCSSSLCDETGP